MKNKCISNPFTSAVIGTTGWLFLISFLINASCQAQNWQWTDQGQGITLDWGYPGEKTYNVCQDNLGNAYATGSFSSSISFGSYTLTCGSGWSYYLVKYNQSGNVLWAKTVGVSGNAYAYALACDAAGNVFVSGTSSGTVSFDTYTPNPPPSPNGGIFLAKYDPNGTVLWAKNIGVGQAGHICNSLAFDNSGNIIMAGSFNGSTVTLGSTTLMNLGFHSAYVAKLDPSGNVLWAKGSTSAGYNNNRAMCTDNSGNIYITGYFIGNTIGFGTNTLTSAGGTDVYLAKYDASGNVVWAKSFGAASDGDDVHSICCNANGDVFMTMDFSSSTLQVGTFTLSNSFPGEANIFIMKVDGNGTVAATYNTKGRHGRAHVIAPLDTGFVVSGQFYDVLTLSNVTLTCATPTNTPRFLARFDGHLNLISAFALNTGGTRGALSVNDKCNVLMAGFFDGSLVMGTTTLSSPAKNPYIASFKFTTSFKFACAPSGPVGIPDNVPDGFYVAPNPGNGTFELVSDTELSGELHLVNELGQVLFSEQVSGQSIKTGITGLKPGIYFLLLTQPGKTTKRGKVLVE